MSRAQPHIPSILVSEQLTAKILPMSTDPIAHFSSLEAGFFKEGDDLSNWQPALDESNEPTRVHKSHPRFVRNWPLAGAAIGLACVAGFVLLARAHREAAFKVAEPTPEVAVAATPPAVIPTAPPAEAVAEISPLPAAPAPAAEHQAPSPSQAAAGAVPEAKPQEDAFAACRKAFDQHRAKDVLATCPQAIDATPQSAELAVILAKTEFERGRARQALDWAKKAVALDAERAEAYVYLGGAEQVAGRTAAAKAAYKRYLQLAPQGRHAADLRAVLANL
jgi:tetratricopeptide (TPR) repeat protein